MAKEKVSVTKESLETLIDYARAYVEELEQQLDLKDLEKGDVEDAINAVKRQVHK